MSAPVLFSSTNWNLSIENNRSSLAMEQVETSMYFIFYLKATINPKAFATSQFSFV